MAYYVRTRSEIFTGSYNDNVCTAQLCLNGSFYRLDNNLQFRRKR